jgi:phage shock protein A
LLLAKHRRSRALSKASNARMAAVDQSKMGTFDRMKNKVHSEEAMSHALSELAGDTMEDRLDALGKDDEIERMLADIKTQRGVA